MGIFSCICLCSWLYFWGHTCWKDSVPFLFLCHEGIQQISFKIPQFLVWDSKKLPRLLHSYIRTDRKVMSKAQTFFSVIYSRCLNEYSMLHSSLKCVASSQTASDTVVFSWTNWGSRSWPLSPITAPLCLPSPLSLSTAGHPTEQEKQKKAPQKKEWAWAPPLLLRMYVTAVPQPGLLLRQLVFLCLSDGNADPLQKERGNTSLLWRKTQPFGRSFAPENRMWFIHLIVN